MTKVKVKEKIRYTDAELAEFEKTIIEKLKKIEFNVEDLTEAFKSIELSPIAFKVLEEGALLNSKNNTEILDNHQRKCLNNILEALVRIEDKTYGICKKTGLLIPKERLNACPLAKTVIEVK